MNKSVKKYFLITLIITLLVIILLFVQAIFFKKNKEISLNQSSIDIDLITSVHPSLLWTFEPVNPKLKIKPGEVITIEYIVKNLDNKTTTGIAAFDYYPNEFGAYFSKLNCFCYDLQTLKAGEQKKYSLVFLIDPKVTKDSKTKNLKKAIMQFTFFSNEEFNKNKE